MGRAASDIWRMLMLGAALAVGVLGGNAIAGTFDVETAPSDVASEPVQLGPEVTIATGQTPGGKAWSLSGYASDEGLCLGLEGVVAGNRGGGACGIELSGGKLGIVSDVFGDPRVTFLYGPVAPSVQDVEVELAGRNKLVATVIRGPVNLVSDRGFYIAMVVGGAEITSVTAIGPSGQPIESQPGPDNALPPPIGG